MARFELISLDKRVFAKTWLAINLMALFGDFSWHICNLNTRCKSQTREE